MAKGIALGKIAGTSVTPVGLSALELLVLQPTPFCNIDCSYCYLPDRGNTKKISLDVLDRVFERVFSSSIATKPFAIAWHAGEPLVLPISFYEEAFALAEKYNQHRIPLTHTFQTNGTTIHSDWCRFFKAHDVKIGLSVDGPEFLHDMNRKRRNGSGTHQRVVESMRLMHAEGVPFSVITVLTSRALEHPDALFDFYMAEGVRQVGFNIEEVEGGHKDSSLQLPDTRGKYARFLSRFYDLIRSVDGPSRIQVREITQLDQVFRYIKSKGDAPPPIGEIRNQEASPFAILNFDYLGNFSTFSPELLGMPSAHYGDFSLGNVLSTSIDEAIGSYKFHKIWSDVQAGVAKCKESCGYFAYCGGGSPANKYYENDSFDSTETMACVLSKKIRTDILKGKVGLAQETVTTVPPAAPGVFAIPQHIRGFWWNQVAGTIEDPGRTSLHELANQIGSFAKFKGLPFPDCRSVEVLIRPPERPQATAVSVSGGQSAIVNLGDEATQILIRNASRDGQVSVRLDQGEGYWLAEGDEAIPAATVGKSDLDILLCLKPAQRSEHAGELREGVRISMTFSEEEQSRSRVRLSAGTCKAALTSLKDDYTDSACLPVGDWREPTAAESRVLLRGERSEDPSREIGLIRLPTAIIDSFRCLDLEASNSPEAFGRRMASPGANAAVAEVMRYVSAFSKPETALRSIPCMNTATDHSTTFDPSQGLYIGMHLDNFFHSPLDQRDQAPNRISINIGREDRFLHFVNLTVRQIAQMILNKRQASGSSPLQGAHTELISEFFSLYPSYPVIQLRVSPGEAYIAPTENILHDGFNAKKATQDFHLTVLGNFYIPSSP